MRGKLYYVIKEEVIFCYRSFVRAGKPVFKQFNISGVGEVLGHHTRYQQLSGAFFVMNNFCTEVQIISEYSKQWCYPRLENSNLGTSKRKRNINLAYS